MAVQDEEADTEAGQRFGRRAVWAAFRAACVTMLAVLAALASVLALLPGAGAGVAVLAVFLTLSMSRSQLDRGVRHRVESAVALPVVGLLAMAAGWLLRHQPWAGALVFTLALSLPIWARRFGPDAARIGTLAGLPFMALLVTPHVSAGPSSHVPALAVPVITGWLALFWVIVAQAVAARYVIPAQAVAAPYVVPAQAGTQFARADDLDSRLRGDDDGARGLPAGGEAKAAMQPTASTRMALQMAAALGLALVVGYVFFPGRWSWIVLSAYLAGSGNRGRLDVLYKGVLRVAGALGGTVVAFALQGHGIHHGPAAVILILLALFIGCWLRPFGYGWWALCTTVAFALLQAWSGATDTLLLWPRMEEITLGAALAVGAACLLLPVRSSLVLRRRVADALAAMSAAFDPAGPRDGGAALRASLRSIEQVAPPYRAGRRWIARLAEPAQWIDLLLGCRAAACALAEQGAPADVRRAVGAARQALREPAQLTSALQRLQRNLAAHVLTRAADSPPLRERG